MHGNSMQHLKTEEIVAKLTNLRLSLVPLLNQEVMALLTEIERRLDGGRPVKPLGEKKISEKEQKLRMWYQRFNNDGRFVLPPYEEWRADYLKSRREEARREKSLNASTNASFQRSINVFIEQGGKFNFEIDKNYKLSVPDLIKIDDELKMLIKDEKRLSLLNKHFKTFDAE